MSIELSLAFTAIGIVYIIFTLKAQNKIKESTMLDDSKKKANIIMIWIIPFFWYWLIKGIIKPTGTMTKSKRKAKSNFTESGKGMYPV